jgi:hypothetical protein
VGSESHPWRPPFGLERIGKSSSPAPFEADAVAAPDEVVNPVDLGTILVPADWLLFAEGQGGFIDVAAISRDRDIPGASVVAWFESSPSEAISSPFPLKRNRRADTQVPLPRPRGGPDQDRLRVSIVTEPEDELWSKRIRILRVSNPPELPVFGVTELKLRYDAPISILSPEGELSSMDYDSGWDPDKQDVVVSLPNGSRFVFWRGANYIPFWAGRYNTGLCYEWAETQPPADGFADSVEPLMDKELRYSRVEIVENSPARVHVRWSYQSCDFNYKVWGDSAVEDFYFYPDGFGTRVLTLQSDPKKKYELSEFIILAPQEAYPLDVLPSNLVEALFLDGEKREFQFPFLEGPDSELRKSRETPIVFRVRLNKREEMAGVYFNPNDKKLPPIFFKPFYDDGELVTPAYWGSHWPLARGKTTGGSIDDRIHLTPSHNSIMTWALDHRPVPIEDEIVEATDTLGQYRKMQRRKWAWLIGMSDASDEILLEWARSFAQPPGLSVRGGRYQSYSSERRAHRIEAESSSVAIEIRPEVPSLNPVFELSGAVGKSIEVKLGGDSLASSDYAWDGHTLWIRAEIAGPTTIELLFED